MMSELEEKLVNPLKEKELKGKKKIEYPKLSDVKLKYSA